MKLCSKLLYVALAAAALLMPDLARAQSTVSLPVGSADIAGQYDPSSFIYRGMGLAGAKDPAPANPQPNGADDDGIPPPGFYPADVTNPRHNPAVISTEHHPIYVNRNPSHWGNVPAFLTDLGRSNFIHLLDQYVGSSANNRYTLGTSFEAAYPIPANHTLAIPDILALVHAGGKAAGTGFGNMYHVFLPSGVDMCIDAQTCYSPDNSKTFAFCAFHGAVTFKDIGHVLFSVEPFQDVIGCSVPPGGTPNGQLADSTNNVLSHEIFEALSDPDLNAWWVHNLTFANGNEIGDLCIRAGFIGKTPYWNYGTVSLDNHLYTVQPEYSDQFHGCAYALAGEQ